MDDDGKKPEDEPAEPARVAAQEEGAKLRKVSKEGLKRILAAHAKWQETDGKEGKQANLFGANLEGADLSRTNLQGAILAVANLQRANLFGANLHGANLQEAKLQGASLIRADLQGARLFGANLQGADLQEAKLGEADLGGADLQGADLIKADFEGANLSDADFRNADLSDAKLSKVIGLRADQLAGADLSNAKLSKDIAEFGGLSRVAEISSIARPIFIGILAGCVYSWLTIATTTDARLLTNSASSPLPIIGTEIPIAGFYWVAPILLLAVYVYLHLYLQRLWAGLADLPAVFPDGSPLNKKVYPWLLSGLLRAHFKLLKDKRPLLSRLENWATIFLAWWIVPVTVLVFWGRYLPRHEGFGTGLHVALLVVSVGSATLLQRHAAATLRRDVAPFRWRRPWPDRRTRQAAVAVGLGAVLALVSLGAIEGEVRREFSTWSIVAVPDAATTWVPYAFDLVGYRTYANLRDADLSTKPATWTGLAERPPEEPEELDKTLMEKARAEFAQVKGAPLQGADLRYADAVRAFLAKADLGGAKLQGADLDFASLRGADLGSANLRGAHLYRANLQGADLQEADLTNANLAGANLTKAKGLTRKRIDEACCDDETKLPDYLADYEMKPCSTPAN